MTRRNLRHLLFSALVIASPAAAQQEEPAAASSDAQLTGLTVGLPGLGGKEYELLPEFDPSMTSYAATVPHDVTEVALRTNPPTDSTVEFSGKTEGGVTLRTRRSLSVTFGNVTVSVNGKDSDDADDTDDTAEALRELTKNRVNGRVRGLATGKNLLSVRVVAEDGVTEKTYTVTVTRADG